MASLWRGPEWRIGAVLVVAVAVAGIAGLRARSAPAGKPPSGKAPAGMVRIPGGTFKMGVAGSFAYEGPVHSVTVKPFFLDKHEVTNAQFAAFVKATGYRTVAEKEGWSGVFDPKQKKWVAVDGADWRHPTGPKSSIKGRDNYPVLQVCWYDAIAYAKWAGKRLPTEAEWEFASRGGLEGKPYAWGTELNPKGRYVANYWQGTFPEKDLGKDGFAGVAPVGKFPPNGYGLLDMTGNVWEWVADRFAPDYYARSPKVDPKGPKEGNENVIRGGSFLCATNFCSGFRVAARNKNTPDSATNNTGFRCAMDVR